MQTLHDILINNLKNEQPRNGLRVSDIGSCPTYIYYSIVDPSIEDVQKMYRTEEEDAADETRLRTLFIGTAIHNEFERILKEEGKVVASELELYSKELGISGHLDLLIDLGQDEYLDLIEVKSMNSFGLKYILDKEKCAKDHHEMQVLLYKDMIKPMFRRKIRPSVIYVGKDSADFAQFYVNDNGSKLKKAKKFFSDLNQAIMLKEPPIPEDVVFNEFKQEYEINWKSKYCPIHNICAGDDWEFKAKQKIKELNEKLKSKQEKALE